VRRDGAWEEDPWAQWTSWQGKQTGCWWDAGSWKADRPEDTPEVPDGGGVSEDEQAGKSEDEEALRPWEHCITKEEESAAEGAQPQPDGSHREPKAGRIPDADELRALHKAALRQFLTDGEDLPDSDTEAAGQAAALPEVIPIHGADARFSFYNPTTGGVDCHLCGMHLNSLKQWEDHRTGKKHVKKISNPKLACDPPAVPVAST